MSTQRELLLALTDAIANERAATHAAHHSDSRESVNAHADARARTDHCLMALGGATRVAERLPGATDNTIQTYAVVDILGDVWQQLLYQETAEASAKRLNTSDHWMSARRPFVVVPTAPKMNLAEFRKSGRYVPSLLDVVDGSPECPGYVYDQNLVIEHASTGLFTLTIANEIVESTRLVELEIKLYTWAVEEGYWSA